MKKNRPVFGRFSLRLLSLTGFLVRFSTHHHHWKTTMIETDCTIQHNGHTFRAGGAWTTDDRICCYAQQPERHWHDTGRRAKP
jgi:hypothetical protein